MSLLRSTATQLVAQLNAGQVSSVEITQACLDQIERHDPDVKAFLRVDPPAALAAAREIDARRARGQKLGRLAGLPVAIKDLLCTQGETTTCGSKMLEHFKPPYDATVVARLRAADAVLIGKTNMDEFAMGGSNENSAFFATRNPWDLQRIPGGSSGGSAACVAARMAPLAIGTDTGGSIRQPAGLCGVTGLKPTYGRVSRFGLVAFASSLDQIGPMARTAEDAALLLEVLAGHDPSDSTSVDRPVPPYSQTVGKPLTGLRLGLVREHFGPGLDGEVERAVREAMNVYQSLGATVREVSMRHSKYAVATYYIIAPCEASSNLARYDGVHYGHRTDRAAMAAELEGERLTLAAAGREDDLENPLVRLYRRSRAEGFGTEVKRRIMLGTYALSAGYYDAYYLKALKVRRLIRRDYDEAFRDVDLIAGPVTTAPAFKVGEKSADPLAMYLVDLYTVSANLAGVGGIAFPCGLSSGGLPIGLQLQAPPFEEERMLRAAHMFQQATDWHTRAGGVLNLVFGVRFSVFGFRCSVDTLKQAASAPVPMSEVATIPCGRLRLAFERRGDRVGHTVFLQHEGVAIALLRSVEGTAEEDWPASPPLRDFHLAARDGGDGQVAFLVGMAGRSHWSASIDADPVGEQITFDLACRLKQPPDQLGATYQLLGPPWRVAADGTRAVLDSRLIPVRLALVPLDATLRLDAERLILAPRPPLADPKYPLTARWCFRLEVEE